MLNTIINNAELWLSLYVHVHVHTEAFQSSQVSFEEFSQDPSGLFTNPKLVVRVEGQYYSWQVAAPMIMSSVVFLQVLPKDSQKKLVNNFMPKKVSFAHLCVIGTRSGKDKSLLCALQSRGSFWNFWGRREQPNTDEQVSWS